jgi:hypothetical protein
MGVTQKSKNFLQMKLIQTQGFVFRYGSIRSSNSPAPKLKTEGFRLSSIRQPVPTEPTVEFRVRSYYEVGLKSYVCNLRPPPRVKRVRGICLLTLCLLNCLVPLSKFQKLCPVEGKGSNYNQGDLSPDSSPDHGSWVKKGVKKSESTDQSAS